MEEVKDKYALYTLCSDSYAECCMTMIFSFLDSNKWFTGDVVVLCDDNICKLSLSNRKKFKKIYKNTVFKEIKYSEYEPIIESYKSGNGKYRPIYMPCFYKYEIFRSEYSKVLFLDGDMIVRGNLIELFAMGNNCIYMCDDININDTYKNNYLTHVIDKNNEYANGGFIFIAGNRKGEDVYKWLIDKHMNVDYKNPTNKFVKESEFSYAEQDMFNEVLDGIIILPCSIYNCPVMDDIWKDNGIAKIVHYQLLHKPWNGIIFRSHGGEWFGYNYYMKKKLEEK